MVQRLEVLRPGRLRENAQRRLTGCGRARAAGPRRPGCPRARARRGFKPSQAAAARAQQDRVARGARRAGAAVGAGVAAGGAQAQPALAGVRRALRRPETSGMQGYWRCQHRGILGRRV